MIDDVFDVFNKYHSFRGLWTQGGFALSVMTTAACV
jgi:hypothetical protein